jgi:hypothetical protein
MVKMRVLLEKKKCPFESETAFKVLRIVKMHVRIKFAFGDFGITQTDIDLIPLGRLENALPSGWEI